MATIEELMAEKQRRMSQQQTGSPDLQALMAEKQRRMQQQPSDPFARDLKLADPNAQSLSPIPAGQSVLPDPMDSKSESGTSFEKQDGQWSKQPGFMKTVDMLGTGALEGIAGYAAFMNKLTPDLVKLPNGKGAVATGLAAGQKALADRSAEQQEMYPDSWSPTVGKFAGEMAATAPLAGPAFGGLMKSGEKIAELLPYSTKTVGKYLFGYQAGQELGGVIAGTKQDPNKPDQLFNTEAYGIASDSMLSGILSMAGVKAGAWANKSRELNKIETALDKPAIPRDFTGYAADELQNLKYSPTRKLSHLILDAGSAMTGTGARVKQMSEMLPGLWKYTMQMAGKKEITYSSELLESVAGRVTNTLRKMKNHSNSLYNNGGFKEVKIKNPQEISDIAGDAVRALKDSEIPGASKAGNLISKTSSKLKTSTEEQLQSDSVRSYLGSSPRVKDSITVDEVKSIQSLLSKAIKKGYDEGGLLGDSAGELSKIKDQLYKPIMDSLDGKQLKNFNAAKTFYSKYKQTEEISPLLTKGINDELYAKKLAEKLISEAETVDEAALMGLLPKKGRQELVGAKVAKVLQEAGKTGQLNLNEVIGAMAPYKQAAKLANPKTSFFGQAKPPKSVPETLKTMEGMRMYLQSVKEAEGVSFGRQGTIAVGMAGAMGGGMLAGGPVGLAAAAVSYPAMIWAANHPYLKRAFGAMTKDLSDSAYKHIVNKIQATISRSGFLIDDDGALKHKKEKAIEAAINILDKDKTDE